jgi:hypothetical protein
MKISTLFESLLNEVYVIPKNDAGTQPLRDNDTIRVYHGTSDFETVFTAVTRGISGDRPVARRYSYESNNNPRGLFVSPDMKTVKDFGDYVLEFHTRVSDLESPVWPNGTFTVQGQMSGIFHDQAERELERLRVRGIYTNDDLDVIRNSDRPE